MAASMYIVVEGEDPGFDIFVNGRSLARHEDALERLALRLGVRPLIEFFSADENSMSLLIEEGAGNQELMRGWLRPSGTRRRRGCGRARLCWGHLRPSRGGSAVRGSGCSRSCWSMRMSWRRRWTGRCGGILRLAGGSALRDRALRNERLEQERFVG